MLLSEYLLPSNQPVTEVAIMQRWTTLDSYVCIWYWNRADENRSNFLASSVCEGSIRSGLCPM